MEKLVTDLKLQGNKINDMSFDWYGTRLAVVINFNHIVLLEILPGYSTKQMFDASFECAIQRIKWGHPIHGSILAASTAIKSIVLIYKDLNQKSK